MAVRNIQGVSTCGDHVFKIMTYTLGWLQKNKLIFPLKIKVWFLLSVPPKYFGSQNYLQKTGFSLKNLGKTNRTLKSGQIPIKLYQKNQYGNILTSSYKQKSHRIYGS